MKKKFISILSIITALIIITISGIVFKNKPTEVAEIIKNDYPVQEFTQACNNFTNDAKDDCYLSVAQTDLEKEKDLNICLSIMDEEKQDKCLLNSVAVRHNVHENFLGICEMMKKKGNQDDCYATIAYLKTDFGFCLQAASLKVRDNCFIKVAEGMAYDKKNDSLSLCERVSEDSQKEDCFVLVARMSQDAGVCPKLSNQKKMDLCYYLIATSLHKPDLCNGINDKINKTECQKDSVFRGI